MTFLAFVVPLPYYIEVPGGSEDIRQVLKVNDTEDKEAGAYHFVTVGVQHATLAHMIYAWLTPFTDIRSCPRDYRWLFRCGIYADQSILHANIAKYGQISRAKNSW